MTTILLTTLLGLGAAAAGVAVAAQASTRGQDGSRVVPGVKVADVAVGGLTSDEAKEKVRTWARGQVAKPITLRAPQSGRTWNFPLSDVGVRFDTDTAVSQAVAVGQNESVWDRLLHGKRDRNVTVTPTLKFNEAAMDKRLKRIAKDVFVAPQNAKGKVADDGSITVVAPERKGIEMDLDATKSAILKSGPDGLRDGAEATMVVKEEAPKVTSDMLLQIEHPLVALDPEYPSTKNHLFTTSYGSSSSNRRHNIELATSHINGTILGPGETFSYNDTVGPRDSDKGFRDAPTYQDGQVVPGPGGGVCQVSTTLYNAVLRSPGMKIVRRSHHSMPVHYVPAGCDATVAYGDIDFKFQNTLPGPVLIAARTHDGDLSFGIYGTEPTTAKQVRVIAGDRRYNPSGTFSVTTQRREVDADGVVHNEVLSNDTYQPFGGTSNSSSHSDAPKRRKVKKATPKPAATPEAQPSTPATPSAEVTAQ